MDTPKSSLNSISSPTDENDYESHEEMCGVSKKPSIPNNKHYMSPTISTSSKANPPRRKILAEKNDLFDSQRSSLDSQKMEFQKIGYGEEGSSESPYDPVRNYLTPRPKFLRYKPDRRLTILSWVENCGEDDGESGGEEASWSQEDDLSQEIGEEFEEEEEKCCGLKGLMKFLLCLIVLVLSTSYISSMNSPMPNPVLKAVSGCKDGYDMIQGHFYEILKNFDGGKYYLDQREALEFVPTDDGEIQQKLVTEIGGKNSDDSSEVVDLQREEVDAVDMIESEGNIALENLGEHEEDIEDLEILEDEDYAEINTTEFENCVLYQKLGSSEEVEASSTVPCSENTTSSSPYDTSETENDGVSELSKPTNDGVMNEVKSKGVMIDSMTTMSILMNAIGGFLLSVLVGLYFQKKRNARHCISQAVEPSFKQVQDHNCSIVLANEVDAKLKSPESSDSSKSFLDSIERDFKETYQTRAPSIQLLGEFSVQEMSNSHRSYGMRNSRTIESEVSSHSVSVENVKNNTKLHSSPLHVHPIFSEITSMEDSPYQKNIVSSELYSEGGESRKAVTTTTPLRRSSRIRGRSIKSP